MPILEVLAMIKAGVEVGKEVYALILHRDQAGTLTKYQLIAILDKDDTLSFDLKAKIDEANAQS
jgi:hypothetical protein